MVQSKQPWDMQDKDPNRTTADQPYTPSAGMNVREVPRFEDANRMTTDQPTLVYQAQTTYRRKCSTTRQPIASTADAGEE